ncbi:hypothetical protein PAAG_05511 [Paracoccidioides lutzii Pb01]|uniref:Uncharacterized protein n=1 Tax=Paracoccidioides lutzii (strain ATCC MYA-826 / Pb01) TaxID=502779 RepID=C1H418_PARBA|nr:hypothetical protein PAAG_05511 [Paracoccidioides lutzii Pb01]EEH34462.2 hypothetical protein PAAG_05511 [Paracoccidioides lutzii Pb01]
MDFNSAKLPFTRDALKRHRGLLTLTTAKTEEEVRGGTVNDLASRNFIFVD